MRYKFETREKVTRQFVRSHRNRPFLVGKATESLLGEPNVIAIAAYRKPSMTQDPFFIDEEYEDNKAAIDSAFREIRNHPFCKIIVIFSRSFRGWGELDSRGPKTGSYLASKLLELNRIFPP